MFREIISSRWYSCRKIERMLFLECINASKAEIDRLDDDGKGNCGGAYGLNLQPKLARLGVKCVQVGSARAVAR